MNFGPFLFVSRWGIVSSDSEPCSATNSAGFVSCRQEGLVQSLRKSLCSLPTRQGHSSNFLVSDFAGIGFRFHETLRQDAKVQGILILAVNS